MECCCSAAIVVFLAVGRHIHPATTFGKVGHPSLSHFLQTGVRHPGFRLGARSFTPVTSFSVSHRTKTEIREICYPAFPHNLKLCPVTCLKAYEFHTSSLRDHQPLGLCAVSSSPSSSVCSLFGSHSTRGASATSVIFHGGRLEDLFRTEDWSRARSIFMCSRLWWHSFKLAI